METIPRQTAKAKVSQQGVLNAHRIFIDSENRLVKSLQIFFASNCLTFLCFLLPNMSLSLAVLCIYHLFVIFL